MEINDVEDSGEGCEILSSGLDMAFIPMNSEQLWLPAQDQKKIKSAKAAALMLGGALQKPPPTAGGGTAEGKGIINF